MFYSSCKPGNRVGNVFGDVESVFNHLFDHSHDHSRRGKGGFQPAWDIVELDDSFSVTLELPGVLPDDVKVEFEDSVLTVSGEKKVDRSAEGANFHRSERADGAFERTLEFKTPVEVDGIDASFEHGLLVIRVPKAEKAMVRQIEVKSS